MNVIQVGGQKASRDSLYLLTPQCLCEIGSKVTCREPWGWMEGRESVTGWVRFGMIAEGQGQGGG